MAWQRAFALLLSDLRAQLIKTQLPAFGLFVQQLLHIIGNQSLKVVGVGKQAFYGRASTERMQSDRNGVDIGPCKFSKRR